MRWRLIFDGVWGVVAFSLLICAFIEHDAATFGLALTLWTLTLISLGLKAVNYVLEVKP